MLQQNETTRLAPAPPLDVLGQALFLDLDGTLVDFAAHPEQVVASEELRLLLANLARVMNGAVALVTGRTIASADAVLDGALVHVAGIHGLERRDLKSIERTTDDRAPIEGALADARTLIANRALQADIEDKGVAIALHYRRAPEFADATRRAAADIAQRHGLSILEGKMVIELKLGQRTKADAVADFMASVPFANRKPVAVGDDITDEDAFRAVANLGGHAILVGGERPTAARFYLPDTRAVFAWLEAGLKT
ncbi:MAG: trehalose-phosphatase [Terricaulis sp.]